MQNLLNLNKTDDDILNTELKKLDDNPINNDEKNISHVSTRVTYICFHYRGFAPLVVSAPKVPFFT